jgi:hypothetical protein
LEENIINTDRFIEIPKAMPIVTKYDDAMAKVYSYCSIILFFVVSFRGFGTKSLY